MGRVYGHFFVLLAAAMLAAGLPNAAFSQTSQNAVEQEQGRPLVVVQGAKTTGDGKASRFVLNVSAPVDFSVFALSQPYRLVLDLPHVSFQVAQSEAQIERGLISNFRFGSFGASRSRMVLDLDGPTKVIAAYNLPAVDGNPARVVLELKRVSEKEFAEQALRDMIKVRADGKKPVASASVLSGLADKGTKGGKNSSQLPLIVLDPGHGGVDVGAIASTGMQESALVLDFALALKKKLEEDGHVRVAMTRDSDVFVSLGKRVAFARAQKADLFVSIHADSVKENYVRGATVYTLSDKASDKVAASLAEKENRSDLLAGLAIEDEDSVVADILIDLTRRETANHSSLYSRTLVGALKRSIRMSKTPERSAGFKVLKAPNIPSVLLELGYLSNDKDQSALTSTKWRQKAIDSIAASVQTFFERRSGKLAGVLTSR